MEYLFAGGLITAVVAFWNQVRGVISHVYSHFVIRVEATDVAAHALLAYFHANCHTSPFGVRTYRGWLDFVRPAGRRMAIVGESLGKGTRIFWIGRIPLWASRTSGTADASKETTNVQWLPVSVSFFRGTINPDQLMTQAIQFYNAAQATAMRSGDRHRIEYVSGTDGKPMGIYQSRNQGDGFGCPAKADDSPQDLMSLRLLEWNHRDIGPLRYGGSSLARMYLSPDAQHVVDEIRQWLESRDWHRERGLPWKRGFGLTGVPGTGKTTLVRAIGEDLDLPIFAFDLATFYNDELRREWQRVQANTPCIVLFDDVDAVFQDRVNENSSLTFDCFLNCLDGVSRSDGILTFITTNRPALLSDALTRPGPPDETGRRKIAGRILSDWPRLIESTVRASAGESGTAFERRCGELALENFWADKGRHVAAPGGEPRRFPVNGDSPRQFATNGMK